MPASIKCSPSLTILFVFNYFNFQLLLLKLIIMSQDGKKQEKLKKPSSKVKEAKFKSRAPSSENPGSNAKSGDKKKLPQGKASSADKASSQKKSPATSGTFAQLAERIITQVKEMFPNSQKSQPKSKNRKSKGNCRTESKKSTHGGKHHRACKKHSKMGRSQSKSNNSGTGGHFFELEITNGGEKTKKPKGKVTKTFAALPRLTPTGGCGEGGGPDQKHTKMEGKSADNGEKKGKPASKKSSDPKKTASAQKPTKDTASTKKKPSTCKLVSTSKGKQTNSKTGKGNSDKEKISKDKKTK